MGRTGAGKEVAEVGEVDMGGMGMGPVGEGMGGMGAPAG